MQQNMIETITTTYKVYYKTEIGKQGKFILNMTRKVNTFNKFIYSNFMCTNKYKNLIVKQ